jgi:hypothetical protein
MRLSSVKYMQSNQKINGEYFLRLKMELNVDNFELPQN